MSNLNKYMRGWDRLDSDSMGDITWVEATKGYNLPD